MDILFGNDRPGEYPRSYYAATATPPAPFAPLRGAAKADVCIVGGGYTGLSAALHLAARGYDVVLLEAHRVGFGASGRNGGQVGSGQRLGQGELEGLVGREDARRLWVMAEEAKRLTRRLARAQDVAFHPGIAHACRTRGDARHERAEAERLARDYGYEKIETLDRPAIRALIGSRDYVGGTLDRGAGHLHPLAYAFGLARYAASVGARIHETSVVTCIEHGPKVTVRTAQGAVEAGHVILAANGYLRGLAPPVAEKVMPINNFIVATEPLGERAKTLLSENIAVADSRFVVNYWRLSEDGRLLFGGGESFGWKFPDIVKTVRAPMLRVYPQLRDVRIDYAWGGTLAITRTRLPCFVRLAPNVLSASGYSGHGVAMATMAGRVLAEAVAGASERFDLLAGLPTPDFPGGARWRHPLLVLAMTWFGLRDRLGV